jgi:hypothetical protein
MIVEYHLGPGRLVARLFCFTSIVDVPASLRYIFDNYNGEID